MAAASAVILTAASLALMALLAGTPLFPGYGTARPGYTAPALPGTVVAVTEADTGMMMGGPMRLLPNRATVSHGTVSFSAVNLGSTPHELIVLPLA